MENWNFVMSEDLPIVHGRALMRTVLDHQKLRIDNWPIETKSVGKSLLRIAVAKVFGTTSPSSRHSEDMNVKA
jgi:hypothetical protein